MKNKTFELPSKIPKNLDCLFHYQFYSLKSRIEVLIRELFFSHYTRTLIFIFMKIK